MSLTDDPPLWRGRWLPYLVGSAMIAFGAVGLVRHVHGAALVHTGRFVVVGLALHDGLLAPLLCVAGALAARALPSRARGPVQVGLAVAGVVTLLALPLLGAPRRADNPSVLPLPYGRNLLLVLAGLAVAVAATVVVRLARGRR